MTPTFVIVGASLAGGTAAAVLREGGFDGRIVLVGAEPHPPYERPPLSKEYLRGQTPFEKALVRPDGHWEAAGIETRFGVRATGLDPAGRAVELEGGERLLYDKLLISTGGRNRTPPIPGFGLPGVHQLRTVEDADAIRAEIGPGRRAVVVGMGFVGAEVAASLRQAGVEVVAIEPLPVPMGLALGEEVGRVIEGLHRDHGVDLHLGTAVAAFEGAGRVEAVRTREGRRHECDFAVAGLGIEPAAELAAGAGLAVDDGIVVDEHCRTSTEGIYAAGDVARHHHPAAGRHLRVEHWQHALKHGEAAARSMLGIGAPYDEVHWFWSDQYDANVQYAGFGDQWDEVVLRGSVAERSFAAYYLAGGRLVAAAGVNRGRDVRRSMPLIKARAPVDRDLLADPGVDVRSVAAG